jgi:hypothetical protein
MLYERKSLTQLDQTTDRAIIKNTFVDWYSEKIDTRLSRSAPVSPRTHIYPDDIAKSGLTKTMVLPLDIFSGSDVSTDVTSTEDEELVDSGEYRMVGQDMQFSPLAPTRLSSKALPFTPKLEEGSVPERHGMCDR